MAILAPSRGCFFKINPESGGAEGSGFYKVDGLASPSGSSALLVNGVHIKDDDVVMPVITLENTRILYSFGANFGEVTVSGSILLGKAGEEAGSAVKTLLEFFKSNRVSEKKSSITVSGPPGATWKIFLIGLQLNEPDPQFHTQPFALIGNIAQPK